MHVDKQITTTTYTKQKYQQNQWREYYFEQFVQSVNFSVQVKTGCLIIKIMAFATIQGQV